MRRVGSCWQKLLSEIGRQAQLSNIILTELERPWITIILMRLKNKQKEGRIAGPKLVVSGIGMRSSHGHGYVGMPHCGAEDFRRTSRENIARGVDFLKVFMTKVINATPFIYHFLTLEELRAVVEEAKSV